MKKMAVLFLVLLWIVSVASPALAVPLNIDFGAAGGGNYPSSTFGAASGQAGTWNNITAFSTPSGILDIGGNATSVTTTITAFSMNAFSGLPPGDANALMENSFYSSGINNSWSLSMTGLLDGLYDVYLYDSHNSAVGTGSGNVNGISFANINGNFGSGTFVEGTNYHLLSGVTITGGTLFATGSLIGSDLNNSGLAGMQIVPTVPVAVPEPSTMLLLGSGLVGLVGFGRKKVRK
jgi:hypothetical protein